MQAVIAAQAAIHVPPRGGGTIGGQESGGRHSFLRMWQ